ncbi:hypothetical protein LguiA_026005 [Lonicera macranthoides]
MHDVSHDITKDLCKQCMIRTVFWWRKLSCWGVGVICGNISVGSSRWDFPIPTYKIVIRRLTSLNSKKFHMVINGCHKIALDGVKVLASGSPNTYGAHVQLSSENLLLQRTVRISTITLLSELQLMQGFRPRVDNSELYNFCMGFSSNSARINSRIGRKRGNVHGVSLLHSKIFRIDSNDFFFTWD